MLLLYKIFYILFAICYLPFFLIRGKWHRGFLMRLGKFPQRAVDTLNRQQKVIWLHTVSVGEAQAATMLVKQLQQQYPDFFLVISTVTETGNKVAQSLIQGQGLVIYAPLDIGGIVKKVTKLIHPQLFIISETEIWPNLISHLAKKGIPVILLNGRISTRSFRGYKLIRPFFKQILNKLSLFCMQTERDARRISELGAQRHKVKVAGNMKFDIQKTESRGEQSDLGLSEQEKLFIAGSTHRGEEAIILRAYSQLIQARPKLRLLIAPRHIERTKEIEKLISSFGFKPLRVSELAFNEQTNKRTNEQRILILDTIGQLKNLYAFADIVFVGGSLTAHGGQNPIEPAVFAKAVLFGPNMSNFSDIAESLLNNRAAICIKDAEELKNKCLELLDSPASRQELGNRASQTVQENRGATLRSLELIRGWVNEGQ